MRIQKTLVSPNKELPPQMRVALSTSTIPSPPKATEAAQHPHPGPAGPLCPPQQHGATELLARWVGKLAHYSPPLPHTGYLHADRHVHSHPQRNAPLMSRMHTNAKHKVSHTHNHPRVHKHAPCRHQRQACSYTAMNTRTRALRVLSLQFLYRQLCTGCSGVLLKSPALLSTEAFACLGKITQQDGARGSSGVREGESMHRYKTQAPLPQFMTTLWGCFLHPPRF